MKRCSRVDCDNPSKDINGMLPATREYFYSEKRKPDGLKECCKHCSLHDMKRYREENKEKTSLAKKKCYQARKEYYKQKSRQWELDNPERKRERKRHYEKERLSSDVEFRLLVNLRQRLRTAMKGVHKTDTTKNLVGLSPEELRKYLESKFQPGMSWENYGFYGWHIDHIVPCNNFDLTDPEQQRKCFNYTNLQPLWWYDNLRKNGKVILAAA